MAWAGSRLSMLQRLRDFFEERDRQRVAEGLPASPPVEIFEDEQVDAPGVPTTYDPLEGTSAQVHPNLEEQNDPPDQDVEEDQQQQGGAEEGMRTRSGRVVQARPHQPHPIPEPILVYTDKNVDVWAQERLHKRQQKFKLDDHMIDLIVKPHKDAEEEPLLESLLQALVQAVKKITERLQSYYDSSEHRQVYASVLESHMLRALRTGNFDLNVPAQEISYRVLQLLYNYLDSNQSVRLNDSFAINFKVLSLAHMKHKRDNPDKAGNYVEHIHAGCNDCLAADDPGRPQDSSFLFISPHGFPGVEDGYKNMCLILSLVVGLAWCKKQENDSTTYDNFLLLHQPKKKKVQEDRHTGGVALYDGIQELLLQLKEKANLTWPEGIPIPLRDLPAICEHLTIQVHIFSSNTNKQIYSYPKEFKDSRKQICLYQVAGTNNTVHLHFISNLRRFFRIYGTYCFACRNRYFYSYYKHMCHQQKMCKPCRRPLRKQETYVNTDNISQVCDSAIAVEDEMICAECNLTCNTLDCFEHHQKQCKTGWSCPDCQKYIYKSGAMPNHKAIKEMHDCRYVRCRHCLELKEDNHLCPINLGKAAAGWNRLGFWHFQFIDAERACCTKCAPKQLCQTHSLALPQDQDKKANLCSAMIESTREHFTHSLFVDEDLHKLIPEAATEETHISYLPSELKNLKFEEKVPGGRFGKNPKKKIPSTLKKGLSVQEDFLLHILSEGLINTTFLSHGQNGSLHAILDALLRHFVEPNVVRAGGKLISVELQNWGIRFLDITSYVPLNERDIQKNYLSVSHFPQQLNHPNSYHLSSLPEFQSFCSFLDSTETYECKKKFHETCEMDGAQWTFPLELLKHSRNILKCIALASTHFIEECTILQTEFQLMRKQSTGEMAPHLFLFPYNSPITSKAAYIMHCYKMYFLQPGILYSIKNEESGIGGNVSQAEYEFVSWVQHRNPTLQFRSSLTGKGQKYFKEAIPDLYCESEKFLAFMNGCAVHGHTAVSCSIMKGRTRNFRNELCEEVQAEFWRKIEDLLDNHKGEFREIVIIWECDWRRFKKNNEEVTHFLSTLPKRPFTPLKARDSCK